MSRSTKIMPNYGRVQLLYVMIVLRGFHGKLGTSFESSNDSKKVDFLNFFQCQLVMFVEMQCTEQPPYCNFLPQLSLGLALTVNKKVSP